MDFSAYERGAPFNGDASAELRQLRERLAALQLAQTVHRKRVIVILEGWVGSGKKGTLRQLASAFDPCHTTVHCISASSDGEDRRHWFVPFWEALPAPGETSLFFRSWYSRAIISRVAGELNDKAWTRAFDEINEFENQQREHGTVLVKLFFHVSAELQAERVEAQLSDPWRRHLLTQEEVDRVEKRQEIDPVVDELYDATDTRWAPWTPIDASETDAGQITALRRVIAAMEKGIPSEPPTEEHSAEIVDFLSRRKG